MFSRKDYSEQIYENVKYDNLPQRGENVKDWTFLMEILYNKNVQNYHKITPKNGYG